jgi:hypothetical protein
MRYLSLADGFLDEPHVTAAMVLGGLVLGALALGAAFLFRWGKIASVLAGFSLAMALSVTLVRPFWGDLRLDDPLRVCVSGSFSVTGSGAMLNFLMLMPLGFFGVLATKRPLLVAMGCLSVSAGIEIAQAVFELGVCDGQDFMNNSAGAVLATVVGWLLLLVFGRGRHQQRRRESRPVAERPSYPAWRTGTTSAEWSDRVESGGPTVPVQIAPDRETTPLWPAREPLASGGWHRP